MRWILVGLIGLAAFALGGCNASGPAFEPAAAEGRSVLYVWRNEHYYMSGTSQGIYIDEERIGLLRNGGYLVKAVVPGRHIVKAKGEGSAQVEVISEAGKSYYFQVEPQMGAFDARPEMKQQTEADALPKIAKTKLSK